MWEGPPWQVVGDFSLDHQWHRPRMEPESDGASKFSWGWESLTITTFWVRDPCPWTWVRTGLARSRALVFLHPRIQPWIMQNPPKRLRRRFACKRERFPVASPINYYRLTRDERGLSPSRPGLRSEVLVAGTFATDTRTEIARNMGGPSHPERPLISNSHG